MRVQLTGATGFLGRVIGDLALNVGDFVQTIGRNNADFVFDFSKSDMKLKGDIQTADVFIHCAGKAHMYPKTKFEINEFYQINQFGTQTLLEELERHSAIPKRFVFISTVAVYGKEFGEGISEIADLEANTPYARSKVNAEKIVENWCEKHNIHYLILRLPLVVGPRPLGNLGAMIRAIDKGYYLGIGKSEAKKSMVMAEDVAKIIFSWKEKSGVYNLTDGYHPSFFELENKIIKELGKKTVIRLPKWMFKLPALIGDLIPVFPFNSVKLDKLLNSLTFDDSKARNELGWSPQKVLDERIVG